MKTIQHRVSFCVVGGGLAGMCAALAAARRGVKTLLMHDRPVLGGNASSEIRMWICGAHGEHMRETGLIEEIQLENRRRNLSSSYAVWDEILFGKVAFQENLTLLLNCSCNHAVMEGTRITSIKGWQLTTETWHMVEADSYADCSGDSILAPLTGAEFRWGRESASEFGEDIAPDKADQRTMGMSCLLQAREMTAPQRFIPPAWAYCYPGEEDLAHAHRKHDFYGLGTNFWWIEIGGEGDSIHDAEENRNELLKIAYGVWDHIKNRGDHGAENWMLEWVGFLPGKRESRRYVGDYVLTQNDVRAGGRFEDTIAYGGWPMDDHHPGGFRHPGAPTTFHPAPSPYGIPFRCVYARTIENLLFAGRNISATHTAMSSTRVMATCALLGQAVGAAAAIAASAGIGPRRVGAEYMVELQQSLLQDDCYLPGIRRCIGDVLHKAGVHATGGDPEPVRSGIDRPVGGDGNAWEAELGAALTIEFDRRRSVRRLRLVFDSDLVQANRVLNMPAQRRLDFQPPGMPPTLVRGFHVDALMPEGRWREIGRVSDNHQRLVFLDVNTPPVLALRITLDDSWGNETVRVFAADPEEEPSAGYLAGMGRD